MSLSTLGYDGVLGLTYGVAPWHDGNLCGTSTSVSRGGERARAGGARSLDSTSRLFGKPNRRRKRRLCAQTQLLRRQNLNESVLRRGSRGACRRHGGGGCRAKRELEQIYEEIDSLLAFTLKVDDYVDLNSLRVDVSHPPFDRTDLEMPIPQPNRIPDPNEPVLVMPVPPSGLFSLFGKKKYAEASRTRSGHTRRL